LWESTPKRLNTRPKIKRNQRTMMTKAVLFPIGLRNTSNTDFFVEDEENKEDGDEGDDKEEGEEEGGDDETEEEEEEDEPVDPKPALVEGPYKCHLPCVMNSELIEW
jgi:hypothetical protein